MELLVHEHIQDKAGFNIFLLIELFDDLVKVLCALNILPTISILILGVLKVDALLLLLYTELSYVLKANKRVVMMNFFV